MSAEVYWSVDIEADGPYPGKYSMSSFGVVACAVRDGDNILRLDLDDPRNQMYAELKPISGMYEEEAAAVSGLDRDALIRDGQYPEHAMPLVNHFISSRTKSIGSYARPIFVGYPLGFDWLFFYWYLMRYAKQSPFSFSGHLDAKTLYATKADIPIRSVGKRSMPDHLKSSRKHTHNALDDAIEQGEMIQNLLLWRP